MATPPVGIYYWHVAKRALNMAPVKRQAYEAQFKLQAISYAVLNGNRAAAKEFHINESMVRKWRKQESELRQAKETKQSFRGNKARWPQLEDRLEDWIVEERAAGRSVSTVAIRLKATAMAQDLNIQHFQGGPSWCFRFMKRRRLSIRQRTAAAQQLPEDYDEKLSVFRRHCCNKMADRNVPPHRVTSMDELPLTFHVPMKRTADDVEAGAMTQDAPVFSVVLGCHGNGQKLPPMVILKRKTLPKEAFPAGVVVRANQTGRMDEQDMGAWLREVYVQRPDGHSHAAPSLLVCASTHAHLAAATAENRAELLSSELVIIPAGLTKELQPLEMGVARAFKGKLRAAWERWVTDGEHSGWQRRASHAAICEWVLDAWAQVSAVTVARAFAKAGFAAEQTPGSDSDRDDREDGVLDGEEAWQFGSDTDDEDFDGLVGED